MHTIRTVLTNNIGGYIMITAYSGVDFVSIGRASVRKGDLYYVMNISEQTVSRNLKVLC